MNYSISHYPVYEKITFRFNLQLNFEIRLYTLLTWTENLIFSCEQITHKKKAAPKIIGDIGIQIMKFGALLTVHRALLMT